MESCNLAQKMKRTLSLDEIEESLISIARKSAVATTNQLVTRSATVDFLQDQQTTTQQTNQPTDANATAATATATTIPATAAAAAPETASATTAADAAADTSIIVIDEENGDADSEIETINVGKHRRLVTARHRHVEDVTFVPSDSDSSIVEIEAINVRRRHAQQQQQQSQRKKPYQPQRRIVSSTSEDTIFIDEDDDDDDDDDTDTDTETDADETATNTDSDIVLRRGRGGGKRVKREVIGSDSPVSLQPSSSSSSATASVLDSNEGGEEWYEESSDECCRQLVMSKDEQFVAATFPAMNMQAAMVDLRHFYATHDFMNMNQTERENLLLGHIIANGLDERHQPATASIFHAALANNNNNTATANATATATGNLQLLRPLTDPEIIRRIKQDFELIFSVIKDCDPVYIVQQLRAAFAAGITTPQEQQQRVQTLVTHMLDTRRYPRLKDFIAKLRKSREAEQRIDQMRFKVQEFLKLYPNPREHFYPNQTTAAAAPSAATATAAAANTQASLVSSSENYKAHCRVELANRFRLIAKESIEATLAQHAYRLTPAFRQLEDAMSNAREDVLVRRIDAHLAKVNMRFNSPEAARYRTKGNQSTHNNDASVGSRLSHSVEFGKYV